jgi:hypothetical protein
MPRNRRQGLTLLPTLALLLLLGAVTLTLQSRSQSAARILSRLTADLHDRAARDALSDRLRGPLAEALASPTPLLDGPRLDGTPFAMEWNGQQWQARVQDVEGLVDLYLAAEGTLALLPADPRALAARRATALADLPPGARFPTLPMTIARFGLDPALAALVTQSGSAGMLRLATVPQELRDRAGSLTPGPRETEQVTRVVVTFEKVSEFQ